ncbi:MAG: pentapeptide repeat-containing protein [Gammaproteobacteria bacterium]|nr:pentapeptide repeat-containing protein [Gammaproteobacteria bacterium]
MKTPTHYEMQRVLEKHKLWLAHGVKNGGEPADLSGANLSNVDLSGYNLSYANLTRSNLTGADLEMANLTGANLTGADLTGTILYYAIGNGKEVSTLQLGGYHVVIAPHAIAIESSQHTAAQWRTWGDEELVAVEGDKGAEWWRKWSDVLFGAYNNIKKAAK